MHISIDNNDSSRRLDAPLKLNLGCGSHTVEGWVNVDKSLTPILDRLPWAKQLLMRTGVLSADQAHAPWSKSVVRVDVTKRFPWAPNSAQAIYSSHFFEHLTPTELRVMLQRCLVTLRPNGVLRLALPDLAQGIDQYTRDKRVGDPEAGDRLIEFLYLNPEHRGNLVRSALLKTLHRPHGWMYDFESIARQLHKAGFVTIERREAGSGRCPDVQVLDSRPESLFVEALRAGDGNT